MEFIKPKKLEKGDTIAIVSPSTGLPSIFPHIYESWLEILKTLDLNIKEYPSARKDIKYLYEHPEFRAKDINDAFADSEIKAIIASIWGDDSVRILPYLDIEIIKKNPKIIMGYSDTSTMTTYLNHKIWLITLNWPSIMAWFSQWNDLEKRFQEHIKTILFSTPQNYEYKSFDTYSNGYKDRGNKETTGKTKEKYDNKWWQRIQWENIVEWELYGGCFEVMEMMKGTDFRPEKEFRKNKILFLETSEEKPTIDQVTWMLRNYGMQGIFDKISALLIGRARDYSDEEKKQLEDTVMKVVKTEFKNDKMPIVINMDFGHTDPQWILPLGVKAQIDPKNKTFKLLEKPLQ